MPEKISERSFLLHAMKFYDNPQCVNLSEFEEDLKRFGYLKKLFMRYKECGDLKERLILNHIIVLFNLFGVATVELLFFKIERQYWDALATFLVYLDLMPEVVPDYGVRLDSLELDQRILNTLKEI